VTNQLIANLNVLSGILIENCSS